MDETYINTDHHQPNSWSDDTDDGARIPVSKGERLIIVYAGSEEGFVIDALLVYKLTVKKEDYHDNMNTENYVKYIKEKLIPNLEPNSVVVIDNAPYHNTLGQPIPTAAWRKADIQNWLKCHNIPYEETLLKVELMELVKFNRERLLIYKIDEIFNNAGHSVLRLPPYHPDFNPIENIWSIVKQRVANRNVTYKIPDLLSITYEEFAKITCEDWRKACRHAVDHEILLFNHEVGIDKTVEPMIINLESDVDEDSEDSNDDYF